MRLGTAKIESVRPEVWPQVDLHLTYQESAAPKPATLYSSPLGEEFKAISANPLVPSRLYLGID